MDLVGLDLVSIGCSSPLDSGHVVLHLGLDIRFVAGLGYYWF